MAHEGNKYSSLLLFIIIAFQSCHDQKEMVNDKSKSDTVAIHKTLPGFPAIGPGTFGAEAEVISVTTIEDAASGGEYYKADILIHAITGRGSSLTEIVTAGDTISCRWQTYHPDDKTLNDNIANRKLIEAVIEERHARPGENNTAFIIQSYRFK